MNEPFVACLDFTLKYEGGFVNNPRDPGGATNFGITQATLSAWRGHHVTVNDVRSLDRPEVDQIYQANYWSQIRGDYLPAGVNLVVFDFAVNSGVVRAILALQAALGVTQDGHFGLETEAALSTKHPDQIISDICARRLSFLERLKTWKFFGKGWSARVAACRSTAIKLVA